MAWWELVLGGGGGKKEREGKGMVALILVPKKIMVERSLPSRAEKNWPKFHFVDLYPLSLAMTSNDTFAGVLRSKMVGRA